MTPERLAELRYLADKSNGRRGEDVAELLAEVDRLRARDAVVTAFISQRAEFVQALKACTDADADYWRWQGHAEGRRQLAERLEKANP